MTSALEQSFKRLNSFYSFPECLIQELEAVTEQAQQIKFPISNEDIESAKTLERLHILETQIEQYVLQQTLSVHKLLEEFYATTNEMFYAVQIGEARFQGGEVRIYSPDGDWQLIRQESEKNTKLFEYQKEVNRFTDFLIDRFLNQP